MKGRTNEAEKLEGRLYESLFDTLSVYKKSNFTKELKFSIVCCNQMNLKFIAKISISHSFFFKFIYSKNIKFNFTLKFAWLNSANLSIDSQMNRKKTSAYLANGEIKRKKKKTGKIMIIIVIKFSKFGKLLRGNEKIKKIKLPSKLRWWAKTTVRKNKKIA